MAELNLFRDLSKNAEKLTDPLSLKVVSDFKDAQRFILPTNGRILDNDGKALGDTLRLPFPSIIMELESEDNSESFGNDYHNRHIVFVKEGEVGKIEIQLSSKYKSDGKLPNRWVTSPFKMIIDSYIDPIEGVSAKIRPTHERAFEYVKAAKKAIGDFTGTDNDSGWSEIGLELLKPAFKALAELLEALACSNVKAELKPNKKRLQGRRPGELPYDDYHELVVYSNHTKANTPTGKPVDKTTKRREHLRRGHVRTYKNGKKVWVQAHVVNAGALGKITKHYKVKAAK